jgi:hypothetical protein
MKAPAPCKAENSVLGATAVPHLRRLAVLIRSAVILSSNEHFLLCNCRDILPLSHSLLQEIQVHPLHHFGEIKMSCSFEFSLYRRPPYTIRIHISWFYLVVNASPLIVAITIIFMAQKPDNNLYYIELLQQTEWNDQTYPFIPD